MPDVRSPHSGLDELFVPRNELLDAIERRFLAKEGTPWADIEELEEQIYRGVRGLQEQLEFYERTLRDIAQGSGRFADLDAKAALERYPAKRPS